MKNNRRLRCFVLVRMAGAIYKASGATHRASTQERQDYFRQIEKLIEKAPERVLQKAVKGMLPKGPLGREMFRKLKVYAGTEHPHSAQQPQELNI